MRKQLALSHSFCCDLLHQSLEMEKWCTVVLVLLLHLPVILICLQFAPVFTQGLGWELGWEGR